MRIIQMHINTYIHCRRMRRGGRGGHHKVGNGTHPETVRNHEHNHRKLGDASRLNGDMEPESRGSVSAHNTME